MKREDVLQALANERAASEARWPSKFDDKVSELARLGFLNQELSALTAEVLDNVRVGPHGTFLTLDPTRTAAALLRVAAEATAWVESMDIGTQDVTPPVCWYCKHVRPSAQDGGVKCAFLNIYKPNPIPCDNFDRRHGDET